jgi:uroporphyrinogen III methyltransferase/synthase
VVVTRARAQASGLAARLDPDRRRLHHACAERREPRPAAEVDQVVERIGDYSLVCLTSPNGAALLLEALERTGRDARALAGVIVAAIGPGTAAELRRGGIRADVVAPRSIAESLVEALADVPVAGRRVLVARAAEARDVLPTALAERGARVEELALYDTVAESLDGEQLEAAAGADYVTFTSSSTVRFFLESLNGSFPAGARVVSIGPVTTATAREHGLEVHVEAGRHDLDGLVDALLADAASR